MDTLTINPLDLPQIRALSSGARVRITRAGLSAVVFDKLGPAPINPATPETVLAGACGVSGGWFTDLDTVVAHIEAALAPNLPALKSALKTKATARRWEVETGGIVVGGMPVATDDRTKTLLTGADRYARRDPTYTTGWKATNGTWIDLNATTIIALADAVFDHVARCFAEERRLHAAIDAAADLAALQALNPQVDAFTILPF